MFGGVSAFVLLFVFAGSAFADPFFQPQRFAEMVSAEPLNLSLNSAQHFSVPSRTERTNAVTEAVQSFGKQSGDVHVARYVQDPDRIVVQPGRDGVIVAPEPATMVLLGTGLAGAAGLVRRQRRKRRDSA